MRKSQQLEQIHRDRVAGYIPYVEAYSDDSKDIHPVNTDAVFVPTPKSNLTPRTKQYIPYWLPLVTDACLLIILELPLLSLT